MLEEVLLFDLLSKLEDQGVPAPILFYSNFLQTFALSIQSFITGLQLVIGLHQPGPPLSYNLTKIEKFKNVMTFLVHCHTSQYWKLGNVTVYLIEILYMC